MTITQEQIFELLRQVIDPEWGVNIVDLGLIYNVTIQHKEVYITATMTSPACPLGVYLVDDIQQMIWWHLPEVQHVEVELVWTPAWHPGMVTEEVQYQLGWIE